MGADKDKLPYIQMNIDSDSDRSGEAVPAYGGAWSDPDEPEQKRHVISPSYREYGPPRASTRPREYPTNDPSPDDEPMVIPDLRPVNMNSRYDRGRASRSRGYDDFEWDDRHDDRYDDDDDYRDSRNNRDYGHGGSRFGKILNLRRRDERRYRDDYDDDRYDRRDSVYRDDYDDRRGTRRRNRYSDRRRSYDYADDYYDDRRDFDRYDRDRYDDRAFRRSRPDYYDDYDRDYDHRSYDDRDRRPSRRSDRYRDDYYDDYDLDRLDAGVRSAARPQYGSTRQRVGDEVFGPRGFDARRDDVARRYMNALPAVGMNPSLLRPPLVTPHEMLRLSSGNPESGSSGDFPLSAFTRGPISWMSESGLEGMPAGNPYSNLQGQDRQLQNQGHYPGDMGAQGFDQFNSMHTHLGDRINNDSALYPGSQSGQINQPSQAARPLSNQFDPALSPASTGGMPPVGNGQPYPNQIGISPMSEASFSPGMTGGMGGAPDITGGMGTSPGMTGGIGASPGMTGGMSGVPGMNDGVNPQGFGAPFPQNPNMPAPMGGFDPQGPGGIPPFGAPDQFNSMPGGMPGNPMDMPYGESIFDGHPVSIEDEMRNIDNERKQKQKRIIIISAIAAVFVITLIVVLVLVFSGGAEDGSTDSSFNSTNTSQNASGNTSASTNSNSNSSKNSSSTSNSASNTNSNTSSAIDGGSLNTNGALSGNSGSGADASTTWTFQYVGYTTTGGVKFDCTETVEFDSSGKCSLSTMEVVFPDEKTCTQYVNGLSRSYGSKAEVISQNGNEATIAIDQSSLGLTPEGYENALRIATEDLVIISKE